MGTTAAPNAVASRKGRPELLSRSGNIPLTLHKVPATMQVSMFILALYPANASRTPVAVLTVMCVLKSAMAYLEFDLLESATGGWDRGSVLVNFDAQSQVIFSSNFLLAPPALKISFLDFRDRARAQSKTVLVLESGHPSTISGFEKAFQTESFVANRSSNTPQNLLHPQAERKFRRPANVPSLRWQTPAHT